jgi:hypothetical protein
MDCRQDSLSSYNQKLQWFTKNKAQHRLRAKALGLCTRCVVRPALRGKAYCLRCTDYAKQYARKRNRHEIVGSAAETYRDKVRRIADYGMPSKERSGRVMTSAEPDARVVREPVRVPAPPRGEDPFVDQARVGAYGSRGRAPKPDPHTGRVEPILRRCRGRLASDSRPWSQNGHEPCGSDEYCASLANTTTL